MQKAIVMNYRDIEDIQVSFSAAYARKAELRERFYHHFFRLLPEMKSLFADDHSKQNEAFASMLTCCFKSMVTLNRPMHACHNLAKTYSHIRFGQPEAEGASIALMAALEDVMGNDLTETQSAIWQRAMARVMRRVVTAD